MMERYVIGVQLLNYKDPVDAISDVLSAEPLKKEEENYEEIKNDETDEH